MREPKTWSQEDLDRIPRKRWTEADLEFISTLGRGVLDGWRKDINERGTK